MAAHDLALSVQNRLQAAADQATAAQVRLSRMLSSRQRPAEVKVGDLMRLDGAHNTMGGIQIPSKLASRWLSPYQVLEVKAGGGAVRLDLPVD